MSYTIDQNNFSMFSKQLTKNLKTKNPTLKLSDVQEAISKTIGFNNLHSAQKEEFKEIKNNNNILELTPFNNPLSQIDLAFNQAKKCIEYNDCLFQKYFDNILIVVSNSTIANLTLSKEEPKKYKLSLTNWFNSIIEKSEESHVNENMETLFSVFFNEIQKESRKELFDFFLEKVNKENKNINMDEYILTQEIKECLANFKYCKENIHGLK